MPARVKEIRCRCEQCLKSNPHGTVFSSTHLSAHLAAVRARKEEALREEQESSAYSAQGTILALTGKNCDVLDPSTLDVSNPRSGFPSLDEVINALNRMCLDETTLPKQTTQKPDQILNRELNYATDKTINRLKTIHEQASICLKSLSVEPVQSDVLLHIDQQYIRLRMAMESVKRSTPSIDARKKDLCGLLNQVEARLIELRTLCPIKVVQRNVVNTGNLSFLTHKLCLTSLRCLL
jgi:hypothetical protein